MMLHGCETWIVNAENMQRIERYEPVCSGGCAVSVCMYDKTQCAQKNWAYVASDVGVQK